MKKLCAGITASLMLAATAWVGATGPALADYQSDRDALCGVGDTNKCSITIRDKDWTLVEGNDSATVDVVGTPGVSSTLKMYTMRRMEYAPDYFDSIRSYGAPVAFTTNSSGKTTVKVPIAVLTEPDGGFTSIGFQLAGSTRVSSNDQPIQAVERNRNGPDTTFVQSARGADVTGSRTVADGRLPSWVLGGITGDVYGVQIEVKGKWVDVTDRGIRNNGLVGKDASAKVYGDVSGYPDGDYEMRMFNRTRGIYELPDLGYFQHALTLKKNLYITPGEHNSAGRKWRTTCEPYSQTDRCRTEIMSTEVVYSKGKLVKDTGWHFNNLTYKESKRALWKGNPLGNAGKYTIKGRQWRTECDTKVTGGNGCRSYIVSDVVRATKKGKSYTYKMVNKEVFNNIVLFEVTW